MSKVAIVGNPSGTGVFTIQSPNTSTDRTLTLPDSTGTVDTLGRAGNVLQVVNFSVSSGGSTTSTAYVDTNLTASITPQASGNKILILVSQYFGWNAGSSGRERIDVLLKLTGATTADLNPIYYWGTDSNSGYQLRVLSMNYLYTTTSAAQHTFTTQVRKANQNAVETGTINYSTYANSQNNNIVLMEIAG